MLERIPATQDNYKRAALHLCQHARSVALPAHLLYLSLRGHDCQQSQEAGVKVAISPPQGSRT